MSIWFFFLSFKPRRVIFKISLVTLYYLSIVFDFMRTITLLTLSTMCIASESGVFPLPTILALKNTKVHIGSLNDCNMLIYVKTSVNKTFSLCTTLKVPNVNPYNNYV